ncbi:VIR protein [Plasmodium vivax]|uniref:VIR protein n=1 Tax=Plasmodium vivax TaxID=5855 RepID=A0A1G4E5L6_PLAVI|nr:VIR protein [Plasmodium vivax]
MEKYFGTRRSIFLNWKKLEDGKCLNKYSTIITELEEEIDKFNKIQHTNFYREWKNLNKTIIQKNNEIKDCVAKKQISNDLYVVDAIKRFRERCPKPNASTCRNNPAPHVRESPSIKVTRVKSSCTPGKNCNKETGAKREEKTKLQSGVPAGNPKRTSSPRLHTKDERPQHPTEKEPIDTSLISQAQPITTHTAHLVSEDKVQRNSITSEQDEAQKEQLAISVSSKVNVEEASPNDPLVQTVINNESATGHSSGVMDPDKNTIQSKLPGNETFNSNVPCQKHISDQFPRRNDEALSSNIRDTTFMTAGVSLGEKPSDNDHVDASPKNADLVSATSSEQLGEETTTEKVPGDLYTTTSAGSQINISSDGNCSNADTDTENVLDKTLCTEGSGDNMLSSGVPCNAEKGNEIDTNKGNILDTLNEFFNGIPNNPQIIKTSMPIGIALLLGLLFKVN